ncbi:MAG: EFR1 family ferrodoxin [Lachnospiraceae bacterium]
MLGIYLSGMGNTKHCIEKLIHLLDETAQAIPIEREDAVNELSKHDFIVLAYPVQFSNAPIMVRDFIKLRSALWKKKKVLCVATMGLFSGDGAGCSARLLKKYGAKVVGGLHIHMPDSVCDVKLLKKTMEKNQEIIKAADKKIEKWADKIKNSKYPKDGLYFYDRIAGFIFQRFWCYGKTKDYSDKLKINHNCTGCGLCVRLCPMENLMIENNKATAKSRCTMCYRCISSCPQQAITLLGDTIIEQCRYEQYVKE